MNLIIKLDLKLNNIFKKTRLVLKYKFIIILIFVVVFITSTFEERKKEYEKNDLFSEKWIVMITFNPPKSPIKHLLNILNSWKIVIIGNIKKNDEKWKALNRSTKFVYLSKRDQIKLGYKTIRFLDLKSYSSKNIGYLYAIQHGAKEIYEIDEDIIVSRIKGIDIGNVINVCYGVRNDSLMINPYSYFGEKNVWPRGFRISDIGKDYNNDFYMIRTNQLFLKPLVFQGLINGIPDVDSIFLQTRINKINRHYFHFSDIYPLLYFPGQYIPLNSKNTKYLQ